jgi:nickel superoxide dismutase
MKQVLTMTVALTLLLTAVPQLFAHCEVPCGIYADQRRFEELLEDQTTIAKAVTSIQELAEKSDALSHNQLARWVVTKEQHATNTQDIIAQYFMTQRIKPGTEGYEKKLTAAHAVMIAAMKAKQTVDPAATDALRQSILDFYRAYEGKEPQLEN